MCPGALPTENHPNKSHQSVVNVTRRHIDIVQDHPIQEKIAYQSIEQLKRGIEKSALKDWVKNLSGTSIVLKLHDSNFDLPKYVVVIEADLTFYVAVYNWNLPVDHVIYTEHKQSMRFVKVAHLLAAISDTQICQGIQNQLAASECVCHVVPKVLDIKAIEPFQCEKFYRSKSCQVQYAIIHMQYINCTYCTYIIKTVICQL